MTFLYSRPRMLLTLTSIFWAGNMVLGRAMVGAVPPVTLAFLRWTLASLILLPFAWQYLKEDAQAIFRNVGILLFLGFMGPALFNTLSYLGLLTTAALNGLVLSAAGPMFIALTAWGIFGDRPSPIQLCGMSFGFAGVLPIVGKGSFLSLANLHFNPGDLLLLSGMLSWGIYTAFLRKRPKMSSESFNFVTYAIAAVVNAPLAFTENELGNTMTANWFTAGAIVYVAIFPSLLAYMFYNRAVDMLGPATAGLYLFLVPVFGAVFAMAFLGEELHVYHALGFTLILSGVLIGSRGPVSAGGTAS